MPPIQILSDIHLEAPKGYDTFEITPTAPYLALLGDIGCVTDANYFTFLDGLLSKFKIVFLVPSNHEPYHSDWDTVRQKIRQFEKESAEWNIDGLRGHFILLDRTRYDISPDTTILGCVLYSNVPPSQVDTVSYRLNDFYHIKDWTVEAHNAAHTADLTWLNAQVTSIAAAEPNRKIIILTHYSPTTRAEAIDPAHSQSTIGSGFSTDLSREVCWTSPGVKVWAFGHTHFNCDFVDEGSGGKRVVTNQRGYYFQQAPGFDGGKFVDA